jgi:hypothetical protein
MKSKQYVLYIFTLSRKTNASSLFFSTLNASSVHALNIFDTLAADLDCQLRPLSIVSYSLAFV